MTNPELLDLIHSEEQTIGLIEYGQDYAQRRISLCHLLADHIAMLYAQTNSDIGGLSMLII